eukprot:CAMPEP_0184544474 /NCGR_PEP_ID=MMETSP0199_2-20130426/3649_1 /TAXON_ID=1112570 /ORGANISM="Thraustochytrium sp., Strain LLF1b" /LENGTH=736 /DNA_ID=CAMNT_0026938655 /DNA_START=27 /DNA_END=2237 /DNA_ORIENTATION=+
MSCCGCSGELSRPSTGPLKIRATDYADYVEADAAAYCAKFPNDPEDLAIRSYTSNLIGRESSLVLHGGGNTSVKMSVTNKLGDEVEVLCIKGSGYNLDSIVPRGFPQVELAHLRRMLQLESLSDPEMVNELRTHMMDASSPNPSVETLLHALIPEKFVDHSHADAIVAMADHDIEEAKAIFKAAFGDELTFAIVPYHMPGFELAGAARKVFDSCGEVDCLILLKHGLFTWGPDAKSSYEKHVKAVGMAEKYLEARATPELTLRPHTAPSTEFFDKVSTTLRGLMSELSNGKRWILSYRESEQVAAFAQSEECEGLLIGPITPDHVIRTKAKPCLIRGLVESEFYSSKLSRESVEETAEGDKKLREFLKERLDAYVEAYHAYFEENNKRVGGIKIELDPLPRVFLVENFGLFTVDADPKACSISADIYEHTATTIMSCLSSSDAKKFEPISTEELFDVEYWDLEQAKLKLGASKAGPLKGQVALITGGGSGIGLATAELFAKNGACIYILDMLEDRVKSGIETVAKACKNKFAVSGSVVDVTKPDQIEDAMHKACMLFGGIDIVVSNAGVVVQAAPGIASVEPKQLELSMNVNFYGHQWVSAAAVRRMVTQGTGGSLLYNVSKAPLNPGPKLGPYVIAKAATLALMRQYCVEYGAAGIRSNCVNADRVRTQLFDMELVEKRANARGLTAEEYFKSNLLSREVLSNDVAEAFLSLTTAEKTTGAIFTVDGGNIAAAPR